MNSQALFSMKMARIYQFHHSREPAQLQYNIYWTFLQLRFHRFNSDYWSFYSQHIDASATCKKWLRI